MKKLTLILATILLFGCGKDDDTTPQPDECYLTGTWRNVDAYTNDGNLTEINYPITDEIQAGLIFGNVKNADDVVTGGISINFETNQLNVDVPESCDRYVQYIGDLTPQPQDYTIIIDRLENKLLTKLQDNYRIIYKE